MVLLRPERNRTAPVARLTAVEALAALLGLATCADPGATAATAPSSASATTAAGKQFNLSPEQYYDDDSASTPALQSGRADVMLNPRRCCRLQGRRRTAKQRKVGTLNGGGR